VILGGSGLIGRTIARRLLADGDWAVDLTGRDPDHVPVALLDAGARFHAIDRGDGPGTTALIGSGADLLVDCVCFTAEHARSLLPLLGDVGGTVMLSSKAVYVDSAGNHVNSDVPPRFDGPIREDAPVMAPGDIPYASRQGYGANKVAAEQVLLDSGHPVTVIRASKVHGEGAVPAREWYFVRRILDGRPVVVLADRGAGIDHTTAAANTASLVETVAGAPGRRIVNSADPDAPDVLTISRIVAAHLGHSWDEVLLDGMPEDGVGRTPWSSPSPIVLDMTAAQALGYRPAGSFAETVIDTLDWLVRTADEQRAMNHEFFHGRFDYSAEDAYVKGT
jgi:nucleoside-diphosphate-sugar epimerase